MAKRKQYIEYRKCTECIHEYACQMWNIGSINQMDATHCISYETVKDSSAYICGLIDGKRKAGNVFYSAGK